MARVAGVAGRVVRGTLIACGVAAVAGVGFGYAAGAPVQPEDITPARHLPEDLCERLGDVSGLLPKTTTKQKLIQTGRTDLHCRAAVDENNQPSYTSASIDVWIRPYGGRASGANQPPDGPATVAQEAFDDEQGEELKDRPYSTKIDRVGQTGGQDWSVSVVVLRADLIVRVEYQAHPITRDKAEQVALVMADRAIWEAR